MAKNRILIVEDDADIADVVAMNLQYSNYEYVTIDDGSIAAQHLAEDHSFDLAILDIMLPGLDGFALMEHMQKYRIPVLYLTAKDDVSSKIKGLREGAEDYLVKPFEVLELLVRIEKILGRTGKLNNVLRFRDITVDQEKRTVLKCGEPIALQPLVEKAQSAEGGLRLSELKLPNGNYTFTATGADGNLTVRADAPVSVPKAARLPMARVAANEFTQQQVTGFFNYLFPGEKPTYYANAKDLGIMTKDEIQNQIIYYKKLIAEGNFEEKSIFASVEEINAAITKLEEQLPSAPDTLPPPEIRISDGTMLNSKTGAYFENRLVWEEDIYRLDANLENISITAVAPASPHGKTESYFSYWDTGAPIYSEANAVVYDENNLPEGVKDKLGISFGDAKALCDNFFAAGGVEGIALRDTYLIDDERFGDSDGVIAPAQHYAYCLSYSRKVGGVPVYSAMTLSGEGEPDALPWSYERIYFYVDNEGIRVVRWYSPTQTGEVLSEDARILPFEEVQAIFEAMVVRTYEPQAKAHPESGLTEAKLEITICDVELTLVRVREQNADGRNGVYTPAWVFYGNIRQDQKWAGQNMYTHYDGGKAHPLVKNTILLINAIDGSIIDLSKGY